jgi:hypothetical protein
MPLNESKGNMYEFVTHTWNVIKGACYHDCSYCYMKRWGKLNPVRFDQKELKTDLGSGNFIFVGSSCDMFANDISMEWIQEVLNHCSKFDNKYLFQSKQTFRLQKNNGLFFPKDSVFCTTIETNRWYKDIMNNCEKTQSRAFYMPENNYVTIEPIMDFDLNDMLTLIKICNPKQVNIGADSGNNNLPEPSKEKLLALIDGLKKFTVIDKKNNLKRLLK